MFILAEENRTPWKTQKEQPTEKQEY